MRLNHQLADFDLARSVRLAEAMDRLPDCGVQLARVTLGDASCTFRNQHTVAKHLEGAEWVGFLAWARERELAVHFHLPLVVKQSEFRVVTDLVDTLWGTVDGFVTADVGMARHLGKIMTTRPPREVVLAANVLNRRYAAVLADVCPLLAVRPLFQRRSFIAESVGVPKDVVAYGNFMINSSTFCFHCGDLPTRCDFSCEAPKRLVMEGEEVAMVGRSLMTRSRIDLIDLLPEVEDLAWVTLVDLDVETAEAVEAVGRMGRALGGAGAA